MTMDECRAWIEFATAAVKSGCTVEEATQYADELLVNLIERCNSKKGADV